jgi:hypothetical protein
LKESNEIDERNAIKKPDRIDVFFNVLMETEKKFFSSSFSLLLHSSWRSSFGMKESERKRNKNNNKSKMKFLLRIKMLAHIQTMMKDVFLIVAYFFSLPSHGRLWNGARMESVRKRR